MKKWLLRLGILFVLLIIALFAVRNVVARRALEKGIGNTTGFPLTVGSMDLDLFKNKVTLMEVKLENPADFPVKNFVEMPRLHVEYRPGSFFSSQPHLNFLDLAISNIVVVRNAKGETNLERLKGVGGREAKPASTDATQFRVDTLHLSVGTLTYRDYTKNPPTVRTIPANVDATYKDITESTDITRLVLVTVMSKVSFAELGVNLLGLSKDLGPLKQMGSNVLQGSGQAVKDGLLDAVKGLGKDKK